MTHRSKGSTSFISRCQPSHPLLHPYPSSLFHTMSSAKPPHDPEAKRHRFRRKFEALTTDFGKLATSVTTTLNPNREFVFSCFPREERRTCSRWEFCFANEASIHFFAERRPYSRQGALFFMTSAASIHFFCLANVVSTRFLMSVSEELIFSASGASIHYHPECSEEHASS
jgi:hypothetical protein